MKIWLKLAIVAAGMSALPLTYNSNSHSIGMNDAFCRTRGGTCCDEVHARCYPNDCSELSCSVVDQYWETTGKCNPS